MTDTTEKEERVIKFRGLQSDGRFAYGSLVRYQGECVIMPYGKSGMHFTVDRQTVGQFTGLLDKNGIEIYEGDIIESRTSQRSSQTHYGDNILNGEYTEPMEPVIVISRSTVTQRDGCFTLDRDNDEMPWPIGYGPEFISYDLEGAKEGFEANWATYGGGQFVWVDPEDADEGDLPYLLEKYKLADESALVAYLGMEVIGNIHQNPELLEGK